MQTVSCHIHSLARVPHKKATLPVILHDRIQAEQSRADKKGQALWMNVAYLFIYFTLSVKLKVRISVTTAQLVLTILLSTL